MNIAINGFGRIGRAAFKILLEKKNNGEDINIVAINDLAPAETMSYLLKYDSVYGVYPKDVSFSDDSLIVDGVSFKHLEIRDPSELPWKEMGVDVVIESTGVFTDSEGARKHIDAGARKVVLSAPAKDDGFKTMVLGSNDFDYGSNDLVSNASCTTNCVTPVINVLSKKFGVEKAMLTTVHAYTSTQSLVDGPAKKDPRRGRAAAVNMIPSSTGAAKATGKALPEVNNIFDGVAIRVPVISGSISDVTAILKKDVSVDEINETFKIAQEDDQFKNILKYTEEPLVSSDIVGSTFSSIVDGSMTRVVAGNMVKVMAWYDNEWGYSNRLAEMAIKVGSS